ncbi:polysaccharide biosynthesis C-terminal domain-containing protein [Actinoallomurus iriomotensis]|uniref:Polysaccharide biosynthesis protein n=1 Tax=Actinoallomurus iriomotensis TaxID=478107 RepID=A0A9W6VWE5_9ACTN|nr:polysaccharide biosynthesis C-terminal domain-containing protein [Actinoallomurus iriomotensis]GLY80691.1 polysaccharide biosynthesis protein [Actinoallomurus iriomotensis]
MRTAVRQVAHTVGIRALLVVLGAVSGIVIARALQPEGRGAYYVITTIGTITISVGHLSIEQAQVWLWSRGADRRALTANGLVLGLAVGALAAVAAGVLVGVLGQDVIPIAGYGQLATALAAIPCAMAVVYLNNILVLRSRVQVVNTAALLGGVLQCGPLLLLAAVARLSPAQVVLLWAVSVTVPLAVLVSAARPRLHHWDRSLARRAVDRGLRYHLGLTSLFLLFRADILILDGMTTTAAVGLYSLAVSLAELTRLVTDAIAQIALPRQLGTDDEGAAAATLAVTRLSTIVAVASVASMCLAAPPLIPLVYGTAFAGSVPSLIALAPGLLALGATRPIGAYLLRLDRPMLASSMSVAALLVNVALNLALVPFFGIVGSAVASSIAYATLAALQVAWFVRASGASPRDLLPGPAEVAYARGRLAGLSAARRSA